MSRQTQIVAQWSDAANYDELIALEGAIAEAASDVFEVDGHDIGSGTFNVFIYADDAAVDATVAKLIQLHEEGKLALGMKIGVAQYKDAARTDWEFKPAYPPDLKSFELI